MNKSQRNILKAIISIQQQHNQEFINDAQITEKLGLDSQVVQDNLALMAEQGYVTQTSVCGGCIVSPTPKGRITLQEVGIFTPKVVPVGTV
jgi:Mn-dependent DtxR family transcriptional regulator